MSINNSNGHGFEMQSLIRPNDELEGSLIAPPPPTSSEYFQTNQLQSDYPYQNSSVPPLPPPILATAIPYNDNIINTTTATTTEYDIQNAEYLPSYNQLDSQRLAQTDDDKIRVGKEIGKLKAEAELELDHKGMRNAYAKNYHENENVKAAKIEANVRDREGLEITEDKFHKGVSTVIPSKERLDSEAEGYDKGGYKVSEYETTDYECSNYNSNYEYKSVYD